MTNEHHDKDDNNDNYNNDNNDNKNNNNNNNMHICMFALRDLSFWYWTPRIDWIPLMSRVTPHWQLLGESLINFTTQPC